MSPEVASGWARRGQNGRDGITGENYPKLLIGRNPVSKATPMLGFAEAMRTVVKCAPTGSIGWILMKLVGLCRLVRQAWLGFSIGMGHVGDAWQTLEVCILSQ
jgi:hypothetical protein